jgi:predicted phosphodiesterase
VGSIFFCGDVHGDFTHVIEVVGVHRPSAVILLGDLQSRKPLEVELGSILPLTDVWYIHGNHDTDSDADYDHLFESKLKDRNLHGRVVTVAGLRIAGLGGVFRKQVWMPPTPSVFTTQQGYSAHCGKGNLWRGGLPRKHRSSIFPEDYTRLLVEHADVLVTHEAPSSHPHGFRAVDDLARGLGVSRVFHGHHHDRLDYADDYARLAFKAYGVGFRGITDCNGQLIRSGDFDEFNENSA